MAFIGPSAGVCILKASGVQYQLRGSLNVDPSTIDATEVANLDGTITYTEKPVVPMFDMEISDSGGLSIVAMGAMRNTTATAELANGKTYVLSNAFTIGRVTLNADTGAIKWKIGGDGINEIGVSAT